MKKWIREVLAKKHNQQGMTLVELLAVIVIMGIVAAIATVSIGGIIDGTKDKADNATEQTIKEAARLWVLDQTGTIPTTAQDISTKLVTGGYLPADTTLTLQGDTKVFTTFTVASNGTITVQKAATP